MPGEQPPQKHGEIKVLLVMLRPAARKAQGRQFRIPPHRFRLMKSGRAKHVLRHGYQDILRLLSSHRFETMPCEQQARLQQARPAARAGIQRGNPMPIVQADRLTRIGAALLRAAGASEEEPAPWRSAASTPTSPGMTRTG